MLRKQNDTNWHGVWRKQKEHIRGDFGLNTEQVERLIVYNDINADSLLVWRTVPNKLATQARQSYVPYCLYTNYVKKTWQ